MTLDRIFSAQDSEVTFRDMKGKFGKDGAWYVYLDGKNDGHTTTRNSFHQGSVLPLVPITCTLL